MSAAVAAASGVAAVQSRHAGAVVAARILLPYVSPPFVIAIPNAGVFAVICNLPYKVVCMCPSKACASRALIALQGNAWKFIEVR